MARRLLCSPTVAVLFLFNLVTIGLLISNEAARRAIINQLTTSSVLSDANSHYANLDPKLDFGKPPAPNYVTRTRLIHDTQTVFATTTMTATQIITSTITSMQTIAVSKTQLDGLPGFCDECGKEDHMCTLYGRHNLERSRVYEGPNTRLRRVLQKAVDGHPIKIGVLGGSVSVGHGIDRPDFWTNIFFDWWNTTFPNENNVFINGAVPATTTEYYSTCALEHIDEDVDLVIIEMAINDQRMDVFAKAYEWLVRLLLELPNKPAVINAQVIGLSFDAITTGGDLHNGVAEYYDLPTVSLRNVMLDHVLENRHLERDMFVRKTAQPDSEPDLRHIGRVGHKMLADLLTAYMQRQICAQARLRLDSSPLNFQSQGNTIPGPERLGEIPRLLLFQRYVPEERVPPVKTTCISTRSKKHPLTPTHQTGWTHWAWKDKSYLIAKEPGARIAFTMTVGPLGVIKISYLKSKTFGLGSVKCWVDNNEASGRVVDGWWDEEGLNISRDTEIAVGVTAGTHEVTCELLKDTKDPGGGHEFRLISLTSI